MVAFIFSSFCTVALLRPNSLVTSPREVSTIFTSELIPSRNEGVGVRVEGVDRREVAPLLKLSSSSSIVNLLPWSPLESGVSGVASCADQNNADDG